jgi:hypothetical protein
VLEVVALLVVARRFRRVAPRLPALLNAVFVAIAATVAARQFRCVAERPRLLAAL